MLRQSLATHARRARPPSSETSFGVGRAHRRGAPLHCRQGAVPTGSRLMSWRHRMTDYVATGAAFGAGAGAASVGALWPGRNTAATSPPRATTARAIIAAAYAPL